MTSKSSPNHSLSHANLSINELGTPESVDYGDVYYANDNGINETTYVFLEGNDIEARWLAFEQPHFCIAETGFGTGLNFFVTASLFLRFKQQHPEHPLQHLSFVSTEKHPICLQDLKEIYNKWLDFKDLTQQWLAQYPHLVEGAHRRTFGSSITLDLHYGDATSAFENMHLLQAGNIDAWFLDGFAPSKNNSMWQKELFSAMARLTKKNGTFATFTAAGFVKRGLLEAGFAVSKRKGFGHKREMLIGCLENRETIPNSSLYPNKHAAPFFHRHGLRKTAKQKPSLTIIGNGLAGAILALKSVQQGQAVNLIWQGDVPADGASGAPIGGFYPQLNAQNNHASQIQLHSFLYASQFYQHLARQINFEYDWCGALQLAFNDNTQTRLNKLQTGKFWPKDLAQFVNAEQASTIANVHIPYDALYMPQAGWISPSSLVNACINLASKSGIFTLQSNTVLLGFREDKNQVIQLQLQNKLKQEKYVEDTDYLVLATGYGSQKLLQGQLPLRLTRGQIELLQSKAPFSALKTLLCHKGYFSPAHNGIHALGSTYIKDDECTLVRAEETAQNFAMHAKSMANADWVSELMGLQQSDNNARAALRCSSPDHLPLVGSLPHPAQATELADLYKALPIHRYSVPSVQKNVFVLTALGSRGLTTAPLMAEILLSQMLGRPLPLPNELLNALNPNRFLVRQLIRRQ